ncbi:unnamed protein product [Vitrella brassicaformis CCMP3155]|uniref:Uncharacterized protein n=1 Tax=Vitrella brassicaformis (strain CCMP3155) TaxID=1169540 RepID=A0A0G4GWG2_VITBC|nr:unnamed protein product [Vitrella brassicaformis CCMP3155]|eukprot:CEM35344.1 unnamed protein product [Vitrella brassicaformis CCMP3155]
MRSQRSPLRHQLRCLSRRVGFPLPHARLRPPLPVVTAIRVAVHCSSRVWGPSHAPYTRIKGISGRLLVVVVVVEEVVVLEAQAAEMRLQPRRERWLMRQLASVHGHRWRRLSLVRIR